MEQKIDKEQVEKYINTVKSYGAGSTYDAVTNYHRQLRSVSQYIKDLERKQNPDSQDKLPKYESLDDMLNEAIKILGSINNDFALRAKKVLNDYMITKNIQFTDETTCLGKTSRDSGNRLTMDLKITKDTKGIMCLCQELMNASVYSEQALDEKKDEKKKDDFIAKTAKMFVGTCVIDYIMENYNNPPFTAEQIDLMKYQLFNEFSDDIHALEIDKQIMDTVYDQNPKIFENNMENLTADDFLKSMETLKSSTVDMTEINERIADVAENGETPRYIMGSCMSSIAGMELHEEFEKEGDPVTVKLIEAVKNNETISATTNMTNQELLNSAPALIEQVGEKGMQGPENEEDMEMVMQMRRTNPNLIKPQN